MAILNNVRYGVTKGFPSAVAALAEHNISIKRIEVIGSYYIKIKYDFFDLKNVLLGNKTFIRSSESTTKQSASGHHDVADKKIISTDPQDNNCRVEVNKVTADWCLVAAKNNETGSQVHQRSNNVLTAVSFSATANRLVAIVGPVGAGKVYLTLLLLQMATSRLHIIRPKIFAFLYPTIAYLYNSGAEANTTK